MQTYYNLQEDENDILTALLETNVVEIKSLDYTVSNPECKVDEFHH